MDVPDIYMKLGDLQLWIELKAAKDNEALKLRPGQINWITKHGAGAMLLIRQLTNDGRHRQWVALDHLGVALLRHLRRPTPDIVVASLSCRVSEGDLEGLLHETGRET